MAHLLPYAWKCICSATHPSIMLCAIDVFKSSTTDSILLGWLIINNWTYIAARAPTLLFKAAGGTLVGAELKYIKHPHFIVPPAES